MSEGRSNPIRMAGQALQVFLKSAGLLDESRESLCVIAWPKVAGEWYALHTYVVSLRGRTLYVRCDSAPRAQQMQLDSPELIRRINEHLGEELVAEIRPSSAAVGRVMDDLPPAAPEPPTAPTLGELDAIEVPQERLQEIIEVTRDVEGEMRQRLQELLLAQARLAIWRSEHGFVKCPGCGAWHIESADWCLTCRPRERPSQAGGDEGLSAFFQQH
jgi:predicted nucleic acid-binding Zn ribbon protein